MTKPVCYRRFLSREIQSARLQCIIEILLKLTLREVEKKKDLLLSVDVVDVITGLGEVSFNESYGISCEP